MRYNNIGCWTLTHIYNHTIVIYINIIIWIISHKPSLIPPLFIEVPVQSQDSESSCRCVLGLSILPISTIFLLNFEQFQKGGIFA